MKRRKSAMNYIAGAIFALLAVYTLISSVSNLMLPISRFMAIPSFVSALSFALIAVGLFTAIYPLVAAGAGVGILYSIVYVVAYTINYSDMMGLSFDDGLVFVLLPMAVSQIFPILYNIFLMLGGFLKKAALPMCIVAAAILFLSTVLSVVSSLAASGYIAWLIIILTLIRIVATVLAGIAMGKRAPDVYQNTYTNTYPNMY